MFPGISLRLTPTVITSGFFAVAACACALPWQRFALSALSGLSAVNHATLHAPYRGKRVVRVTDRALAHGIAAAQLWTFTGASWRMLVTAPVASLLYVTCLGGAVAMFYVAYPKQGTPWHLHHAALHAVCAVGSVAFDVSARKAIGF